MDVAECTEKDPVGNFYSQEMRNKSSEAPMGEERVLIFTRVSLSKGDGHVYLFLPVLHTIT